MREGEMRAGEGVEQEDVRWVRDGTLPSIWMDGRVHPGWVEPLFALLGWRVGGLDWSRGWNIPRRCGFTPSLQNWRTELTQFSPSGAPCPPSSPRAADSRRWLQRADLRPGGRPPPPRARGEHG